MSDDDEANPATNADPASAEGDAMRKRWTFAVGMVSWLAAIIAPAVSFDVEFALDSESGPQFQAYFLILSAVLFLLGWKMIHRLRIWMLGVLALCSVVLFITYSLKKSEWTCAYYPILYENRFTKGTELRPPIRAHLEENPPADSSCQTLMAPWGGHALAMWEREGVVRHFLTLFGLYAFAWLSLALLVLGAVRTSLKARPRR